ncbi:hypothetical protein [Bacillus sp. FJAT-50079]|uniref:hypothetical protein n=1 Tax=Bacillus sp. FJAT-50079 TaxID=2833577 RepID=UPI001BC8D067|nr:hypothetical protein [Bacillus sp. FJAT-50079]MBS4208091.1 hypothetical protein [Bacillus sp. FJAT-50079]
MILGESKQDITPLIPIELAGFAHRDGKTREVMYPLFLKTYYLQMENKIFLFIVADLIWWDTDHVKKMKAEIEDKFKIPKEHICFHATHNHSGPQTSARFSREIGRLEKGYVTFLNDLIFISIEECLLNKEKVRVEIRKGKASIGVHRRKKVNDVVVMEPNVEQLVDDTVTVITFITNNSKNKAIWIHYSCHPTCTDANILSSEFPGVCCRYVEAAYDSNVAYLQGFCGDIRPALIKNDKFHRGTVHDMELIGKKLAAEVLNVLKKDGNICNTEPFLFRRQVVSLSFSDEVVDDKIPKALLGEWPTLVRNIRKNYELLIQYIKLCEGLTFISCNAELVEAYGKFIKERRPDILPLGYSNGMVGYICTQEQMEEGGYEAEESLFYFGYPSKLSPSTERDIQEKLKQLMEY